MTKGLSIVLCLFLPLVALVQPKQTATIKGNLNFAQPIQSLFIAYATDKGTVTDTAHWVNKTFRFNLKINEPVLAYLTVRTAAEGQTKSGYQKIPVYIEPGIINITAKDSLKFAIISGSTTHDAYKEFSDLQADYDAKSLFLRRKRVDLRNANDESGLLKLESEMEALEIARKNEVYLAYLNNNIQSPIALYVLKLYAGYDIDAAIIEPYFYQLNSTLKSSGSGKEFKGKIETAKKTGIGVYAMNFTQNDTLGNPVSLASFKGKYVLIDFWASWCAPCRADNPNLVKAYNAYKNKGFTIIGISLDRPDKKQAWLDAIHKDGLTWTHVSDLQYWNNAVAKQYGINAIPQNLLIDPTGKIIGKNLHGDGLEKKLATVLK